MHGEALLRPVSAPRPPATQAEVLLRERIFLLADAHGLRTPVGLDPTYGGLAVCGGRIDPLRKARAVRAEGYVGPLVVDPGRYAARFATAEAPFVYENEDDGLFFPDSGLSLDVRLGLELDAQLAYGATVALTPTGYLRVGDRAALRAVVDVVADLDRRAIIVVIPAAVGWLVEPHLDFFTEVLATIRHPVALAFGGQFNPLDLRAAQANLRRLLTAVPGVAPWRTDFAAFDGVAHGAPFAAIGASSGMRHLVPPDEKARTGQMGAVQPAVLIPRLLSFVGGGRIARLYANRQPPTCDCLECAGRALTRFDGSDGEIQAAASRHNAATWNRLLPGFFGEPGLGERQAYWKRMCQAARDAHEIENSRLRQKKAFTPPKDITRFATLPVTHAPLPQPARGG
ncbi:hypothetical protein MXD61_25105 [Frankia sp. AgPm24]|uniref:hypothetical protein n=1 Tax=Frankia sp. AgPm24 TaxID=631128 RepID=UPI00200CBD1F|nr:hypothetical protein [Frankia sp. AgPm24]MCK9925107.1 hypothetical protein [Frankia sp. AgPm24]